MSQILPANFSIYQWKSKVLQNTCGLRKIIMRTNQMRCCCCLRNNPTLLSRHKSFFIKFTIHKLFLERRFDRVGEKSPKRARIYKTTILAATTTATAEDSNPFTVSRPSYSTSPPHVLRQSPRFDQWRNRHRTKRRTTTTAMECFFADWELRETTGTPFEAKQHFTIQSKLT